MTLSDDGIWIRLTLTDGSTVRGFARGADSPNDFWAKFRTQMIRIESATRGDGDDDGQATIYVNREQIVLARVVASS